MKYVYAEVKLSTQPASRAYARIVQVEVTVMGLPSHFFDDGPGLLPSVV